MSSFNKKNLYSLRYNYNSNYNKLIKHYNNHYFIYKNKYLIRYEYYNLFIFYIRNGDNFNLQYLLQLINNQQKLLSNKDNTNEEVYKNINQKQNQDNIKISIQQNSNTDYNKKNTKNLIYDYTKKNCTRILFRITTKRKNRYSIKYKIQ